MLIAGMRRDIIPALKTLRGGEGAAGASFARGHCYEGSAHLLRVSTGAPESGVVFEQRLLAQLAQAGLSFATPSPHPARNGTTVAAFGDTGAQFATLTPVLVGVAPAPGNLRQAAGAGAALGELVSTLARIPASGQPSYGSYQDLQHARAFGRPASAVLAYIPTLE